MNTNVYSSTKSNIWNNDKTVIQRDLDSFVKWINLTSMSFNMSKHKPQAFFEIKNEDHTCGMRKCVFEMGTLKLNPLKRVVEAKPQQGIATTLV